MRGEDLAKKFDEWLDSDLTLGEVRNRLIKTLEGKVVLNRAALFAKDSFEGRIETMKLASMAYEKMEHDLLQEGEYGDVIVDSLQKLAWETGWMYGYIARNMEVLGEGAEEKKQ